MNLYETLNAVNGLKIASACPWRMPQEKSIIRLLYEGQTYKKNVTFS